MYLRTESWTESCHHERRWSEELSFSRNLQDLGDTKPLLKGEVLAHIISMYYINDGKSCSCVTWELNGKDSWNRSLSVSTFSLSEAHSLTGSFLCPGEQRAALGGMCCGVVPDTQAEGKPWCRHSSGDQAQHDLTAPQSCSLFQHVFMPLHRLAVAHLCPAALLYSREFMLWIYGWIMSLFKLPHRTKEL